VVFSQSQGQGWERGSRGVAVDPGMSLGGGRRGTQGTFPYPSRDGGVGREEAIH